MALDYKAACVKNVQNKPGIQHFPQEHLQALLRQQKSALSYRCIRGHKRPSSGVPLFGFLTPLINFPSRCAVCQTAFDTLSSVDAIFPGKDIWVERYVDFAPFIASNPRKNSNIRDCKIIAADVLLSL